ncbi:hypothetical protein DUNSADRAFT_5318 [Dunaliella salina]|uniref:Uncharacterized protein n=1 Tax=Dunaliella salina TaxID=3046 RepID=A0ABQ7FUH9_DUNSA|nr:hypothetical protein DUNSADRAFT_5318 [Dunaliella salina]|eukprot:KAF5826030.1 hypothetical protein DUNSADRAFT_5318 [Dunaliella salina]
MSETLGNEEAAPLFDQAGEHFRDAAVVSLIQWGNVFIVKADRLLQALTKAGKPIKGKDLDAVMALYDATQKKIEEGLRIKPDSWEAVGSLAQLEWERAKAKLGYVLPVP